MDKDEEGEVHLQNFIQSAQATLLGRTSAGGARASSSKAAAAFIPTPDATGVADDYAQLYSQTAFAEPSTFIRFSDTVEDLFPVAYLLDEDDADWLARINAPHSTDGATRPSPRGRDKGKEPATPGVLVDDEFELLMDTFERTTDDLVPILHIVRRRRRSAALTLQDTSRIPTFEMLNEALDPPRFASVRPFAKAVYPHWRDRRLRRGGRPIIPQLDHDESREDNPYVCFRRREAKNVRKTRRTDAQNVERLIRLRADLAAALELLQRVAERERSKREQTDTETAIFEARVKLREAKRAAGENEGDDDVLIAKKERKRRRLEDLQPIPQPIALPQQRSVRALCRLS